MSLSAEEMNRRFEAAVASLDISTHDKRVLKVNESMKKGLHDGLERMQTLPPQHKYKVLMEGLEGWKEKGEELTPIVQQRIYVTLNILDPVQYPWEGQYTTKPTVSTRKAILKQYMNDHPGPRDVNALVAWLRDFYCKTYLGDCPKARAIVHFLDSNPPAAGISVTEYLKQFQHGRNETLAQLIGGNRLSHLNRSPWGLKQVIQLFQYEKCSMDTTATQNTKIMFKP